MKKTKRHQLKRDSSSSLSRPSNDLHQEVVDILINKYSLSKEEAGYVKAGLYHMVKEKFANLSNIQRAIKLKESANNEDEVKKMIKELPKLKDVVTKARELRQKERELNKTSSTDKVRAHKDTKEMKSPKDTKTPKEPKAQKSPKETKTKAKK